VIGMQWKPTGHMHFLPHPGPLPLGEGETASALRKGGHAVSSGCHVAWVLSARESGAEFPLPAGEGQGEGERPENTHGSRVSQSLIVAVHSTACPGFNSRRRMFFQRTSYGPLPLAML
jgi:hypothetical protein